jgi:hypothetical protein
LTVLHPDEDNTTEEEVTQDLLALIASFAGRLYGFVNACVMLRPNNFDPPCSLPVPTHS